MIVIADTSPINYLILIGEIEILNHLFSRVIIPEAVSVELQHSKAPQAVKDWIDNPPYWLETRKIQTAVDPVLQVLGPGEREAITLATELGANLILMDERKGYEAAVKRNLKVAGTLFVLEAAAAKGFVNLSAALARLQKTSFRISPDLIQKMLNRTGP